MPYGKRSSRQRPHDAAYSSRAPSVERQRPRPCRSLRRIPTAEARCVLRRLAERVLNAEIGDHLDGEAAEGRKNHRNGYSRKN
jgi:hypothetical protein